MVGQHFALLKQGRNQTVGNATVGCTFAHGVNAWVGHGLQCVADHNAALAMQVHFFGQRRVGTNTHRHHHQLSGDLGAIFEQHRGNASVFIGL